MANFPTRKEAHEIHIEPNPDRWRGGFEWAIVTAGVELDCGLSFSEEEALKDARQCIAELYCSENQ